MKQRVWLCGFLFALVGVSIDALPTQGTENDVDCDDQTITCENSIHYLYLTSQYHRGCRNRMSFQAEMRYHEVVGARLGFLSLQRELEGRRGANLSYHEFSVRNFSNVSDLPKPSASNTCQFRLASCKDKKTELEKYIEQALSDIEEDYQLQVFYAKELVRYLEEIAAMHWRFQQQGITPNPMRNILWKDYPTRSPYVEPTSDEFDQMVDQKIVIPNTCPDEIRKQLTELSLQP